MSIYENRILAFIQVIESGLIPTEEWADLEDLPSQLPEDMEGIYEEIENWLQPESRLPIREAYKQRWQAIDSSSSSSSSIDPSKTLGQGGAKSPTKSNEYSETSRELLINTIKNNPPLSNPPPPKP
jgi:hypothetical protein